MAVEVPTSVTSYSLINQQYSEEQLHPVSFGQLKRAICLGEQPIPTDTFEKQALADALMTGLKTMEWPSWPKNRPNQEQQINVRATIEESLAWGLRFQIKPLTALKIVCGETPTKPIRKSSFAEALGLTLGGERTDSPAGYTPTRALEIVVNSFFRTRSSKSYPLLLLHQQCLEQGFVALDGNFKEMIAKLIVRLGPRPLIYLPYVFLPKAEGGYKALPALPPQIAKEITIPVKKAVKIHQIWIDPETLDTTQAQINQNLQLTSGNWTEWSDQQKSQLWNIIQQAKQLIQDQQDNINPDDQRIIKAKATIRIITMANIGLAYSLARKKVARLSDNFDDDLVDELSQTAAESLYRNLEYFDPDFGYEFSTYIYNWLSSAIDRYYFQISHHFTAPPSMMEKTTSYLRKADQLTAKLGHEPSTADMARDGLRPQQVSTIISYLIQEKEVVYLDIPVTEQDGELKHEVCTNSSTPHQIEAQVLENITTDQIKQWLSLLTTDEASIIRMTYGLDDGQEQTLEKIGRRYHLTRARIGQITKSARDKLRKIISQRGLTFDSI